ncbi:MAG TPA: ABC transporter ATP-binding protein [Bacteroidota bacterium]|nr:ABC transporter ATP-binding protein [Bacteroidota bacterium]
MGKDQQLHVIKGLDMEVREGEMAVIVGPSGSGKSTLLHLLGGLDRPSSGRVVVGDRELSVLSDEELAGFRNQTLGFIFQFHHLLPEFTALENVAMPAMIRGDKFAEAQGKATELLEEVGLGERADHKPNELSGGEQQRVAVARALMNDPKLVLADEPSGNLDEDNSQRLHQLLSDLAQKKGLTFVIATHNLDLTKRAHRVLQLVDGRLVTGLRPLG